MASVHRQKGSPNWVACFRVWKPDPTSPKGGYWQRTMRSTGVPTTKPRKVAEAVATTKEQEANAAFVEAPEDPTRFFERAVRRMMAAANVEAPVKKITWKEWSEQWLEERKAGKSSLMKYRTEIGRFTRHLGARASAQIRTISHGECSEFYNGMLASGLSAATARQAFKTVRSCFHRAQLHGFVQTNPCALVEMDDSAGFKRQPFTKDDLKKIFMQLKKEPHAAEWKIVCQFGLFYGLRLLDAVGRSHEEITQEGGIKVLQFVPMKKRRKGQVVTLPLVPPLHKLNGAGLITPHVAGIENLSKVFGRILKSAGVKVKIQKAKGEGHSQADKTFHSFRHTCNTMLANAGVDVRIRQLVSDHDSASMNARYTHPALESMAEAVKGIAKVAGV